MGCPKIAASVVVGIPAAAALVANAVPQVREHKIQTAPIQGLTVISGTS